jgi:hypothetical protein
MNNNFYVLALLSAAFAVIAGLFVLALYFKKKKVNTLGLLSAADNGIDLAKPLAEALKPFLPGIAGEIVDTVLKYADGAVKAAEKVYKDSALTGDNIEDTRKCDCTELIKNALTASGIEITEDTDRLINAAVPLFVMLLPKTHETPVAVEATEK